MIRQIQRLQKGLLVLLRVLLLVAVPVSLLGLLYEAPSGGSGAMASQEQPAQTFQFPAGGRQLFPANRLVALYGTPGNGQLGVLGEQPPAESIGRAKQLAEEYQPLMREHAYPALELITTIAAGEPTDNNDFSREVPLATLWPWVNAAKQAGIYVVLDLQPGSSDFVSQAKLYEPLLEQPHVGLALDPEWRLQPGKHHLEDIGSVSIDEVNATANWLATLTRTKQLPQKMFLLHEFRLSMVPDRARLNTTHSELATVIQMDGQGDQQTKLDTYAAVTANPPASSRFAWKNFYAKDTPTRTPADTMTLKPEPWYVSYQ